MRGLRKYAAILGVAVRHAFAQRAELLARVVFLEVILMVFARLWTVAAPDGIGPGTGARELLWYLAVTEWIAIGIPMVHADVSEDVRSGDVAYQLARPISWVGLRLADGLGRLAARLVVLGAAAFAGAWALTGGLPSAPAGLAAPVPLGVAAAAVATVFQVAIGLSAVWLHDATPLYWVWQKLTFVLGGLILPLEIYPGWLRELAAWTPFAAILNAPARVVLRLDAERFLSGLGRIAFWGVVAALLVAWLEARARRVIDVHGG